MPALSVYLAEFWASLDESLVGEVVLSNVRSLNQELVRAKLAWWYRQYTPYDTTLAQQCEAGRSEDDHDGEVQ